MKTTTKFSPLVPNCTIVVTDEYLSHFEALVEEDGADTTKVYSSANRPDKKNAFIVRNLKYQSLKGLFRLPNAYFVPEYTLAVNEEIRVSIIVNNESVVSNIVISGCHTKEKLRTSLWKEYVTIRPHKTCLDEMIGYMIEWNSIGYVSKELAALFNTCLTIGIDLVQTCEKALASKNLKSN